MPHNAGKNSWLVYSSFLNEVLPNYVNAVACFHLFWDWHSHLKTCCNTLTRTVFPELKNWSLPWPCLVTKKFCTVLGNSLVRRLIPIEFFVNSSFGKTGKSQSIFLSYYYMVLTFFLKKFPDFPSISAIFPDIFPDQKKYLSRFPRNPVIIITCLSMSSRIGFKKVQNVHYVLPKGHSMILMQRMNGKGKVRVNWYLFTSDFLAGVFLTF